MLYKEMGLHSYRELPLRFCEFATLYRYEKRGELNGLARVRALGRVRIMEGAMIALTGQRLTLEEIEAVAQGTLRAGLAPVARQRMEEARALVERIVAEGRAVYGVNTGFGRLSDYAITGGELKQLQHNLLRSHA